MPLSIDQICKHLLELLPVDGEPVLNRVMRVMIGIKAQQGIDVEPYNAAREILQRQGKIGVTRGQGGGVFLIGQSEVVQKSAPTDGKSEAELMPSLGQYLAGGFREELDLPKDSKVVVQDVSRAGPREGQWTRPDFLLVSLTKLLFVPQPQLDVHTFELKAERGGSVQAVHEALAQTRFSNFGHLVWHLPKQSPFEARLEEIEGQCTRHGIGLILMRDPTAMRFEVRLGAVRRDTTPMDIDGFLASRLCEENQQELRAALRSGSFE